MRKRRVIVLMGGRSPEHEVSLVSGRQVVGNLDKRKYEVLPLVVSRDGQKWQLLPLSLFLKADFRIKSRPQPERSQKKERSFSLMKFHTDIDHQLRSVRPDVVFIAMHGPYGEDGTIQGMLELAGVPYTGAGVAASALGMDKTLFKKVMMAEGITIGEYLVLDKDHPQRLVWNKLKPPVVVKPSKQGSSVGVTIVHKKEELKKALKIAFGYGPKAIVEKYLPGIEVTCGLLGNENPIALPVVEIIPKKEFFDYETKYQEGICQEIVPARISKVLTKKVQQTALAVFKAIGARGFGRVDMIIHHGIPYVLEINTIPGLTPVSLFPKEAAVAGLSYPQLLDKIIELALTG